MNKINIVYNEKNHTYRHGETGKLFAGVTSIVGVLDKPYLKQWASNMACNYVREHINECMKEVSSMGDSRAMFDLDEKKFDDMLKEAKNAYAKKSDKAKDAGTAGHKILEDHVNLNLLNKGKKKKLEIEMDELTKRAYDQFCKWESEHDIEWKTSEMLVGNMDKEFAGRLDATALVDGKNTIVDFKFADSLSDEYNLQLAGYWQALEWMGYKPENRLLIRMPKSLEVKKWNGKYYDMVENNLEAVNINSDIDFDKEIFLYCREIFRWKNQEIFKKH